MDINPSWTKPFPTTTFPMINTTLSVLPCIEVCCKVTYIAVINLLQNHSLLVVLAV